MISSALQIMGSRLNADTAREVSKLLPLALDILEDLDEQLTTAKIAILNMPEAK